MTERDFESLLNAYGAGSLIPQRSEYAKVWARIGWFFAGAFFAAALSYTSVQEAKTKLHPEYMAVKRGCR